MPDVVRPGAIAWTGDKPFIYLKTDSEGGWSALSLYFRIDRRGRLDPKGNGRDAARPPQHRAVMACARCTIRSRCARP